MQPNRDRSKRKTPLRTLQVEDEPWQQFGVYAVLAGSTRADVLRDVIDWTIADPALWARVRGVAELRGETLRHAVLSSLRGYICQSEVADSP